MRAIRLALGLASLLVDCSLDTDNIQTGKRDEAAAIQQSISNNDLIGKLLSDPWAGEEKLYEIFREEAIRRLNRFALKIKEKYEITVTPYSGADFEFTNNRDLSDMLYTIITIDNDLGRVYEPLRSATRKIVLGGLDTRYALIFDRSGREQIVALPANMTPHDENAKFLIDTGIHHYRFSSLVHEAAHVKAKTAPVEFYREWEGFVDKKNRLDAESHPVSDGFVSSYGRRACLAHNEPRWHEDIATYVEAVYEQDFGTFRNANPKDIRYKGKLELLRRYAFISQQQFDGAIVNLGVNQRN